MTLKRLLILLLLLLIGGLAACSGDTFTDPTPIPPPPTTSSNGEDSAPAATITPNPNIESTETAVQPTPTLIPTLTATATAAATAVTDPPIQVISSQPLPATSRDLLFLADGAFKQWSHTTRQIETIVPGPNPADRVQDGPRPVEQFVGDITSYSMSADGKRAVVARLLDEQATSPVENSFTETSHELLFVDMISREIWTLVPQVDNLGDFQLSPDAQQLAFVATGLNGIPDAPGSGIDVESGDPLPNSLYALATGGGNPGNVRQVYDCQPRCFNPEWHIENNLVAFSDEIALWLYNIAANEPEMLLENQGFVPGMEDIGDISIYSPIDWASNGRYLLLWRGRWEGASRSVLDVPTGTLAPVPDSFVYADIFPAEVSWMPDDRLLVWRSRTETSEITPRVELWRFDLAAGELVLEESATLSDLRLGVTGGTYLEDGRFTFALDDPLGPEGGSATNEAAGIYQLTSLAETPERVNSLPPIEGIYRQANVFWAKDGSGALLTQAVDLNQAKIFYAPTDGDFLYEITAVFGQNPHNFQWQPELVVP
ncbi:MAG: hypothetical protein CL608_06125 [Anaerolineaceae bacterium]|nr:hypothetical protein [Anaerolineaceae bacterium]